MPPEVLAAIFGPVIGAIIGIAGFTSRRNITVTDRQLDDIKESIELVMHQVTAIQIQLPSNYVAKEDLVIHEAKADNLHSQVLHEIRELREEIIVIRVNNHH